MKIKTAIHKVLLIGGGAREHAIAEALCRSKDTELYVVMQNTNPGIMKLSAGYEIHSETDVKFIVEWAKKRNINLAIIGLEDALDVGLPDELNKHGIPTVGPERIPAQLETSKIFARELMRKYNIPGQIEYHYFTDVLSFRKFLESSSREFALKPVGLTAGKGVKIMGEHFQSKEEAADYGEKVISLAIGGTAGLVVEERLIGEELTLQAFVDGETVLPMPLVQDFKRAHEGDTGPNTGSMGSYSQADGLLPFITQDEYNEAVGILRQVIQALRKEGILYQGILYGQFIKTVSGIKLIEMNARFGDPEAMNVLPVLENDFVEICLAITKRNLKNINLHFANKATVCKYITPEGYGGENPKVGTPLELDECQIQKLGVRIYFAKVNAKDGKILTTSSRSIGLLGIGESIDEAETLVEKAIKHVHGDFHVRHDIASKELILRKTSAKRISVLV